MATAKKTRGWVMPARLGRSRRKSPGSGLRKVRARRCGFELLEPRQLLCSVPWAVEDFERLGLQAAQGDLSPTAGQVLYLDFDGASNVSYDGPVRLSGIDIPPFDAGRWQALGQVAPGASASRAHRAQAEVPAERCEPAALLDILADTITTQVSRLLSPLAVVVTHELPASGDYSTIYIGGDGRQFEAYGEFLGLAENVDLGNQQPTDEAFVFSDKLLVPGVTLTEFVWGVSWVAAHEAGHLLGLSHAEQPATEAASCSRSVDQPAFAAQMEADPLDVPVSGLLDDVAHKMEPGMEVHQWLALQAYDLYISQFDFGDAFGGFGELGRYLVAPGISPSDDWGTIAAATHNIDGDNNILEGTADEDTSDNPFGQSLPFFRHFVHGGDGSEMYLGLDDWWIPGSDPEQGGSYYSALEQAQFYWYGWESGGHQPGLVESYTAGAKETAYWYLGHVAHLLADLTVPAHVHGDPHGGLIGGGDDAYEDWVGADGHFQLANWMTTAPGWQIGLPTSLEDWFYLTADYTEDYDSDDYDGWDAPGEGGPEYALDFRSPGRHRPQEVENNGDLTDAECQVVAADLLPWAIEQTAGLYRLFYQAVDTTPPVVNLPGFSLDPDHPTLVTTPNVAVSATATDPESGVGQNLYQFYTAAWNGADWGPWQPHGQGPNADLLGPFGEGLYALTASATNGGGRSAYAPVAYFLVDLNDPPVAEAGGPYEGAEGEPILLDASASQDPDGMIVSYAWDLDDDGRFDDAVGPTALFSARQGTYTVHVQVIDDQGAEDTDSATVSVQHVPAQVVGRQVFYNNSAFDDPAAGRSDADAIAPDKAALLPGGIAGFANYTSYDKGLNGILIDVERLDGTPGPEDFEFLVGGVGRFDAGPESWTTSAPQPQISVEWAQNPSQPDRIKLVWPDGAIRNQWLMVRLKANPSTGLAEDDVFLFGNAVGESGDSARHTYVDGSDYAGARDHFTADAGPDSRFDFNRDGQVDDQDTALAAANVTNLVTCLAPLDLSAWQPSGPAGEPLALGGAAEPAEATIRSLPVVAPQSPPPVEAVDAVFSGRELWLWLDTLQHRLLRGTEGRRRRFSLGSEAATIAATQWVPADENP